MQPVNFICQAVYKAKEAVIHAITSVLGLFNLWLHHAWKGENVQNRNVVVVLKAAKDYNGVFSVPHFSTTYQLHHHKEIQIIYRKVSSIEEIESALTQIKAQNNRIKGLWINAHGSSNGFSLGEKNQTHTHYVSNFSNAEQLQRAMNTLEEDASIILSSCSTGRIGSECFPSIAQTIAELAPHRRIFAPVEDVNGAGLHFAWDKDAITARFTAPKRFGSFFSELLHIFSFGHYGKNITAVIKSFP